MTNRSGGILGWLQRLPTWGAGALALLAVGIVVAGGIFGYRTYDYVEHDNDFCMSCHLMQDPYDRFARSAHRGLGCKACHMPTFVARSQMALTQILENPDTLVTHAEVPNEKCASCHIDGDPERWRTVASSAGHRIHMESDDPALQGLNCVECHSSSLHEFAAASKTCAQSGCHEDSAIQLAGMSDLTIHCTACHGFSTPASGQQTEAALAAAVSPDAESCLSCHAMRVLVSMPEEEPHQQACGACHNPHEQATPEQAVESCATVGCHNRPDTLTSFHRGLEPGTLEGCTTCHAAHTWDAHGGQCLACHQDVFRTGPVAAAPRARDSRGAEASAGLSRPVRLASASPSFGVFLPQEVGGSAPDTTFRHDDHRGVDCLSCHSTEQTHGRVLVTTLRDCRSCHHTQPVARSCAGCHESNSGPTETYRLARTMDFTVGQRVSRQLPFDHAPHQGLVCGECHTVGVELSAGSVDCTACHEEHHRPEVSCSSCHREAPARAHPMEEVHRSCSGSGCHEEVPVAGLPDTRSFCLTCHQDLADHQPGRTCGQCHQVSQAGVSPGRRP